MKRTLPPRVSPAIRTRFAVAGGVSLAAWIILGVVAPGEAIPWTAEMRDAAAGMERALGEVAGHCRESQIALESLADPNGTCLVGPEQAGLFTSLGQVEAKRSATTPDMAGLLVHLLDMAGVEEGDRVAVGASGSFPGLMVATLAAVSALGAEPVTILSLGASSYGATRPDFNLLDLYGLLQRVGMVTAPPVAVSLGGSGDVGGEFDAGFRENLLSDLGARGVSLLYQPDFQANVGERIALYGPSDAFVNIGGAEANLGTSPRILDVPPGLVPSAPLELPPPDQRGVLFQMVADGVPVLHLLHMRGLVLRYGLPWDPIPLPSAGSTPLADSQSGRGLWFWLLTMGYCGVLAAVALIGKDPAIPSGNGNGSRGLTKSPRNSAVTGLNT